MRTRSISAVLITTLLAGAGCRTTPLSPSNDHKATSISADALIYVHGVAWPGWVLSIKRSVERVEHVKSVGFVLKTGIASVEFEPGKKAALAALWKSIIESGFTPVKIESNGEVYKGPK